jgi:uncharacterized membrane protein
MPFRWLMLIAILLVPLVWALWLTEVVTFSFARLGLSPQATLLVLLGSLVGGWVRVVRRCDTRPPLRGSLREAK